MGPVWRALLGAVVALACSTLPAGCDGGPGVVPDPDSGVVTPDQSVDGAPSPDGPMAVLVDVQSQRELRGVWVASVANIDFPSAPGLPAAAQQAELLAIVDTLAAARFNAVFFQVRPEGDALYQSALEPWSRYLTGSQGVDPGYDPLAFLIEHAHARNIEVHAWLNPYRAKANKNSAAVAPHMSVVLADYAYPYGNNLWMDPGVQAVADHTLAVILDLVRRYDVDGVHFDDYFYPYPVAGVPFPDDETYAAYQAQGGVLSRPDWRRDNVNRLVAQVGQQLAQDKPHVRFGISPFGIYRPGIPAGISGLDQYAAIFADPPLWKEKGWVDYLAPQLYWPSTQTAQAYDTLIRWWAPLPDATRYTFVGNFLSKLGSSAAWTVDEFRTQVALTRAQRAHNALGNIFFSYVPLRQNRSGIVDVFRDELYREPSLTPPIAALRDTTVTPPLIELAGREARVNHARPAELRAWTLYAETSPGQWQLDRVVAWPGDAVQLLPGRWAVAVVDRAGVESRGVVVEVN